jgi:hypothetical protein
MKNDLCCKSQDSAGGSGTDLWVSKRSENANFWLENGPHNSTNSSRRVLGFTIYTNTKIRK